MELEDEQASIRLHELEAALVSRGRDLALFFTCDRPARVTERPALARAYFAQRCLSDTKLAQIVEAFRVIGSYVELFEGEPPLLRALAEGRIQAIDRQLKVLYNGIEGGIVAGGFEPGRKALIPAVADSYGLVCSNSNAYACALGRHKFHYFTVLRALGIPTPRVWLYDSSTRWAGGMQPSYGTKVIVKSTYESWSVGVTDQSIFVVDDSCDARVARIAGEIGQPVTVQEFISGREVCVPILAIPEPIVAPPVEAILAKAPGDPDAVTTIEDSLQSGAVSHKPFCGPKDAMSQVREVALATFVALGLRAFGRIDFRLDTQGMVWVTDVGVSPGIGQRGSSFRSLRELDFDHAAFLRTVVAATLSSYGIL